MDPITIAAAIQATRTVVKSAKGISEIAHNLDSMFHAQAEHEKRKKNEPKTRNQQVLAMRAGDDGYDDDTAIGAVANDVIEEKNHELELQALGREIDAKWGKGTWQAILDERAKRIKKKEEKQKKAKALAAEKREHDRKLLHKVLIEGGKAVIVILIATGMVYFLYWAAQKGGSA